MYLHNIFMVCDSQMHSHVALWNIFSNENYVHTSEWVQSSFYNEIQEITNSKKKVPCVKWLFDFRINLEAYGM